MKLGLLLKNIIGVTLPAGAENIEITSVVHDSRKVEAGSLFICLRGLTADGHDFIDKAATAGAAAILVDNLVDKDYPKKKGGCDAVFIQVENTRRAMATIAANFHGNPAKNLKLIGVTGTNGKTTTTYLTEEILRKCGRKTGLIGTVMIGINGEPMNLTFATSTTPDPLELHDIFEKMVAAGVQYVVMEVSSHALALFKMHGLAFEVGVFTNLTQDHLDFHGTMENYRIAKARLFEQSRFAVVNTDDESTPTMLEHHGNEPFMTYGIKTAADLRAIHIVHKPTGAEFSLESDKTKISLPLRGLFNVYNSLAAIGTALALGLEKSQVREAAATLSCVPGRIQAVPNSRGLNVLVDYAHSPDGLENIISAVREVTTGRVITLFGCGGDRDKSKRPIMGEIAGKFSDYCIITSDNPRTETPEEILAQIEIGVKETATPYIIIEDRRDAIFAGIKELNPEDALIIAGKGHENYQLIGTKKHHFDDFEVASEALNEA
ncbi:MAG: UDP-N-acetylmuramoyl-L-alanyl-D-glutamate--2,6-diaminopimelate ligase [Defluviitaleaceae bacterium]|nr:UDP-N-acetylmuramoyl-L-alanyl-D-glutamate--2,6-diaminopimelate ligase [Defluviitaleaceae bacterium]